MTVGETPTAEDNGVTQNKTASATTTETLSESNRAYLTGFKTAKQAETHNHKGYGSTNSDQGYHDHGGR